MRTPSIDRPSQVRVLRVALICASLIGVVLTIALLAAVVSGAPKPNKNAPVANSQAVTTNEDSATDPPITLSATDPNGDALTFAITDQPDRGTLGPIGVVSCDSATKSCQADLTYTPNANFNGSDSFKFQAKDRKRTSTATVSITVNPVNDSPTNITLSNASVDENEPAGTTVGTLSTTDPDSGDTFTYSLVSGTGSDDNDSFQITNGTLQTNAQFDFETKDSYTVRVRSTDSANVSTEKQFTITVNDANDQPTGISLSNDDVDENQPAGTDVGTLSTTDPDSGDTFTYSLVSGAGDTDNGSFAINGSTLETAGPLNFEDGATRSVRIRTSDGQGVTFEEQFTITVGGLNDAPENLALTNDTVDENKDSGTTVGTFSADDEDGDAQTFAFASGTGDTDNGSFTISGSTLQTNEVFDFEAKDSYTIRVEASDGNGGSVEKQFTISITNANDTPTDIELSPSSVDENEVAGTAVGTLSSADQDTADSHSYTLVSGTGDTDNAKFQISGSELQTNAVFDFETKDSYSVRVRTDDGQGGTFEKQLTISITDANDAPTDISLSDSSVLEHQPNGTKVGDLSTTDQDAGDTHTYTLVTGTGDEDNDSFQISGSELQTDADLATGTYSVRIETDDGQGGTFEKQFTITVVPPNLDPTDISLSNNDVDENQPSGTAVGTLSTTDPDSGDTHTYSLVAGDGDTDNASFQIDGSTLETATTLNYEQGATLSVRIQTDDGQGGTFEESFTITVNDANDAPTDISLSNNSIDENKPSGTTIGALSAADPDPGQTHTFSLADTGCGGSATFDNGSFSISGGDLRSAASFDFEADNSYTICVRATDNGTPNQSFDEQFTITINDANDAPVLGGIEATPLGFTENDAAKAVTDTMTVADVDSATLTGATVTIAAAGFAPGQDVLAFNNTANITGDFNDTTGVLTLSGTDSRANYQAALRTVTYQNTSENPSTAPRTVTFQVSDGAASSNTVSRTVSVSAVNDAPVVSTAADTGALAATEQVAAAVSPGLTVADVDSTNLTGATVRFKSGFVAGQDTLAFSNQNGITGSLNATGDVLTLSGTTTLANYQTALRSVTYTNSSNAPDTATTRTIGFVVNDGAAANNLSNDATRNVNVTAVNDAPTAATRNFGAGSIQTNMKRSFAASDGLLNGASDPDAGGGFSPNFTVGTVNGVGPTGGTITTTIANVGTVTANATTGAFDFDPAPGVTGNVSFNYTVCDNGNPAPPNQCSASATITLNVAGPVIWFVNPAAATNGTGTLASPFNTLAAADAVDAANHRIFVYSGTTTGGITLNNGEWLIGQGVPGASFDAVMNVNVPTGTIDRPTIGGTKPVVGNASGNAVSVAATAASQTGVEIRGLSLSGSVNAIDVTATGANSAGVRIADNAITSAGFEGIDVNAGSTGAVTLSVHDNTLTSTGNAIDIARTAGTVTITAFDDNVVSGTTGGSGIVVSGPVTFDAVPGGSLDQVSGGTTALGASGNGVGGAGLVLTDAQGSLSFADLDVFADNGAGVRASGTGTGFTLAVGNGLGTVEATGGPALDLSGVAANLQLASLKSTNSTTTGVSLASVTGTVSAPAISSITNASGTDFAISGGTAAVTYNGTITDDVGQLVSVASTTGGTKSFGGAISDGDDGDGSGISLTNNTGATIVFSGGLTLSSGANPAFAATGPGPAATSGGTVTVTGSSNTISTTTGTALNVANTTIGAGGLTFRSISAGTAAGSAGNGIVLDTTGSSGGLTVTGSGSAASGGTIQNKTGADGSVTGGIGIYVNDSDQLSLSNMHLHDFANYAIRGSQMIGFALTNSTIDGANGTDPNFDEDAVRFTGLTGTASFTGGTIEGGKEDNVAIINSGGTLNRATFSGINIGLHDTGNDSGDNGVLIQSTGGVMNTTVQNSTFDGARGDMFQAEAGQGSTQDVILDNNDFLNVHPNVVVGGGGLALSSTSGTMTYDVNNNDMTGARGDALIVVANSSSGPVSMIGKIRNNRIGTSGVDRSGAREASAIEVRNQSTSTGGSAATMTTSITNNTIRQYGNHGILLQGTEEGNDFNLNYNATVTGNLIEQPNSNLSTNKNGIHINSGTSSGDDFSGCFDIGGAGALANSLSTSGTETTTIGQDIIARARQLTTLRLPGYTGGASDEAAVESYLAGRNGGNGVPSTNAVYSAGAGGFTNTSPAGSACPQP